VSTYLREQFAGVRATAPRCVLDDPELERITRPLLIILGEDHTRYQPIEAANKRPR
jgi:hypothetical protein